MCLFLQGAICSIGQEQFSISGLVLDEERRALPGATVTLVVPFRGEITGVNGEFELSGLKASEYVIVSSMLGFAKDTLYLDLKSDIQLEIILKSEVYSFSEIEIKADRVIERTSVSNISFTQDPLKTNQGLLEDPLRTVSSLPGVSNSGDLFSPSQLYVRGGAPEENLFLIDNNKVYFPYFFGGQKSIFNTETIGELEFISGGFNAAYGNHMSSVMNVQTRDGNADHFEGNVSLGFYNSSALLEGPIVKDKVTLLVGVRRTYLDLFIRDSADFPVPSFGDATYKISAQLSPNHKLSLSGISARESMDFNTADPEPGLPNKLETGATNHFQSVQLKSTFGDKIYNKLSLTHASNLNQSNIGRNINLDISARQFGMRNDLTFYLRDDQKFKAGVQYDFGQYALVGNSPLNPLETDPNDTTLVLRDFDIQNAGERLKGAYILFDGTYWGRFGVNAGLRADHNRSNGYVDLSPRLAMNYAINSGNKVRFSTGIFNQFPDIEGGIDLRSQRAIHYIVGFEHQFNPGLYGWIEAYVKDYQNLLIFDEDLLYTNDGYGLSRGIEVLLRKESGNLRGWLSYTYAKSERLIPFEEEVKDFEFDQRFLFNANVEYHIQRPEKYSFIPSLIQFNLRYMDGTPYTPVLAAEQVDGRWVRLYGETLSERNTDYVNLNARVEWKIHFTKKLKLVSFVEGWNLLNARNVLGRSYRYSAAYDNNISVQTYYTNPRLIAGGFRLSLATSK